MHILAIKKCYVFDQPCLFIEGSIRMHGNKRMNYKVNIFKEKEKRNWIVPGREITTHFQ